MVNAGELALEPTVAKVDNETCEWCGKCDEACPYSAFEKAETDGKFIAKVNSAVCKGCGMCLPVCPENALNLIGLADEEVESMIDALIPNV